MEDNMGKLTLRNFGPIKQFTREIKPFTVLTGQQAGGKSTIAKVVFFFRTVAQDFINQIQMRNREDIYQTTLEKDLKKRLRNKFLQMFGSSWSMPTDIKIQYEYAPWVMIEVFLSPDRHNEYRNFIDFSFGDKIQEFIEKYQDYAEKAWDEEALQKLQNDVKSLFSDGYETIYVPAGRSLTTLLTDSLVPLLSPEGRSLDFCMQSYAQKISSLRPQLRGGLSELMRTVLHTTQVKVNKEVLRHLQILMKKVLRAKYVYDRGEEQLFFNDHKYVKINFASSGQQEAVWVLNLLYFYILQNKKVFLIIEEPEAHLYPDSQKGMAEAIGLFARAGNQALVTTHSPYILGQFNNMLYAGELYERADEQYKEKLHEILNPMVYLSLVQSDAVHVHDGRTEMAIEDGLIKNELIDGVSAEINTEMDHLLEVGWRMDEDRNNA